MTRTGARNEEVRRRNLGTLLGLLHREGPATRAALTGRMGLNRSTIGALVADLAAAGLVREEPGAAGAGAGRPSHLVVPQGERVWVLAVDVGVGHVVVARVGLGGVVLARRDLVHERGRHALDDVVGLVARVCAELSDEAAPGSRCLAAGAAVCGVVAGHDGRVRFGPNLGWVEAPFGDALREALGLPVLVGNDADLGVLAEHVRGAAVGHDHVVYLAGDVGVGGGVLVDGRPLRGAGGYAGEIGHVVVDPDGAACRCGSRGCWETVIGEDALLVAAGRLPGGGLPAVREVVAAAAEGDALAADALDRSARWLGAGLGAVVNVLNPEVVVLGGVLGEVLAVRRGAVLAALAERSLSAPCAQVRLALPRLGASSSLLGAAELAFAPLLADPLRPPARAAADPALVG